MLLERLQSVIDNYRAATVSISFRARARYETESKIYDREIEPLTFDADRILNCRGRASSKSTDSEEKERQTDNANLQSFSNVSEISCIKYAGVAGCSSFYMDNKNKKIKTNRNAMFTVFLQIISCLSVFIVAIYSPLSDGLFDSSALARKVIYKRKR